MLIAKKVLLWTVVEKTGLKNHAWTSPEVHDWTFLMSMVIDLLKKNNTKKTTKNSILTIWRFLIH